MQGLARLLRAAGHLVDPAQVQQRLVRGQPRQGLAGDLLECGATAVLTEMGDEELIQLVSLDVERSMI